MAKTTASASGTNRYRATPDSRNIGSKHNADRQGGHEGRCGDLRRAVEDNFVHVLLGFRLAVAIDVLDLDGGVVHQDADRQSESTEGHDIDRFSDRAEAQ